VRSRLFIDGQHAIFTRESIAHIAHTALGCGITPLARVRSVDDQDVERLAKCASAQINP